MTTALVMCLALSACGRGTNTPQSLVRSPSLTPSSVPSSSLTPTPSVSALPTNVYAATLDPHNIAPRLRGLKPLVYVPNSEGSSVDVIDPTTMTKVDHFGVGVVPHHIFPAGDMSMLYVGNTASNTLTPINPFTHKRLADIYVPDPYNMYWPPRGGVVMVIAERFNRIDFRTPGTFKLIKSVSIPWPGIDHGDFTADGRYWIGSTEYNGVVVKVDTVKMTLVGNLDVGGLPIDIKLSPDGKVMYVANQGLHGVTIIDPVTMTKIGFLPTGRGAHGLTFSRDTKRLFVSNRLAGSVSVVDVATQKVIATWPIGGSPDMFQLSPDGTQLWASGRYNSAVYVIDTKTGRRIRTFQVGREAHGLTYFPNVGRYCVGHNGVYR